MACLKEMPHVTVDVVAALCPRDVSLPVALEDDWSAAYLAGEALLEIGREAVESQERYRYILERVRAWLVTVLRHSSLVPVDRAAGRVLARLGDPRFRADALYLPDDDLL